MYKKNIIFNALFEFNEKFLDLNKYHKKNTFNTIMLINDIVGPIIIDSGMKLSK